MENLYFTCSGNWSETLNMKEKGIQKQNMFKKTGINIFLTISVIILVVLILKTLNSGKSSLLVLIVFPLGLYSAYKYLSSELGSQFKLPISKINNVEITDHNVHLTFLNFNDNTETYLIKGVSEKGLKIFEEIKNNVYHQRS